MASLGHNELRALRFVTQALCLTQNRKLSTLSILLLKSKTAILATSLARLDDISVSSREKTFYVTTFPFHPSNILYVPVNAQNFDYINVLLYHLGFNSAPLQI